MKIKFPKKLVLTLGIIGLPLELHGVAGFAGMAAISKGQIAELTKSGDPMQPYADPALIAENLGTALEGTDRQSVLLAGETNHCDTGLLRALASKEVLKGFRKRGTAIMFVELPETTQGDLNEAAEGKLKKIELGTSTCGEKIGEEQAELFATLARNARMTDIALQAHVPSNKSLKLIFVAYNMMAMSAEVDIIRPVFPKLATLWENLGKDLFLRVNFNDEEAAAKAGFYGAIGALPVVHGGEMHAFSNTENSFNSVLNGKVTVKTILWHNGLPVPGQELSECNWRVSDDTLTIAARPTIMANIRTGEIKNCVNE